MGMLIQMVHNVEICLQTRMQQLISVQGCIAGNPNLSTKALTLLYVLQIVITLLRLAAYFTHEMPLRKAHPYSGAPACTGEPPSLHWVNAMLPGH
jgi:hypothetical protein